MIRNIVTGSTPIFFHAAGPSELSPLWANIQEYERAMPPANVDEHEDVYTFLTWQGGTGAYWNGKELPLFDSLKRLAVPVMVLGRDRTEWKNIFKIDELIHALSVITTPYFVAADLTDVIVTGDPMRAVDALKRSDADLLFCAEDYFWPPEMTQLKEEELAIAEAARTPFSFLNSGLMVGRTKSCIALFEEAKGMVQDSSDPMPEPDRRTNDQPILKQLYVQKYPKVQIDLHCEVFQVITRQTPSELEIPKA